jgi:hypothetical protein
MLAPGKVERERGEHAFWRGSLWGRTVALQGDSSFTKYDLFEEDGEVLRYWGTFRGNGYYDSEESHSFSAPFAWMDREMTVGDAKEQRVTDSLFDPRLRRVVNRAELRLRVEVVAHHESWRDPDSGIRYEDVMEMHYWGRYPEAASREVYHLARGLGTVRFETSNRQEPSGVRYQYAEHFERFTPPEQPTRPWIDPFHNPTHLPNGFFEELSAAPREGGPVSAHLRGWTGSPGAVITSEGEDQGLGPWKIALRPADGAGAAGPDFAAVEEFVPVVPGARYRLSGRVLRESPADNVYLDFDDGAGRGTVFEDAQALAGGTGVWEPVSCEVRVGPGTTGVKVRCVRDGANRGAALFDAVTLQRLD